MTATLLSLAMAASNGCGEADTVVLVRVAGSVAGEVAQFDVRVDVDGEVRNIRVPERKASISLPTSFSIQIPSAFGGTVQIELRALDEDDELIGSGSVTAQDLQPGQQNTVDITLAPVTAPTGDGGNDPNRDAAVVPRQDASTTPEPDASTNPREDAAQPEPDALTENDAAPVDAAAPDAGVPDAMVKLDALLPDASPDAEVDAEVDAEPDAEPDTDMM